MRQDEVARREQEENRRRRGTGGLGWMNLGKTAMECCVSTPAAELNLLGKIEGLFPLLFFSPSSSTALKKKKKRFPESRERDKHAFSSEKKIMWLINENVHLSELEYTLLASQGLTMCFRKL